MNRKAGETEVQRPAFDYLNPDVPDHLPVFEVPLVVADETTVAPFGRIVTDPETHPVEIVPWPASGWRPIDAGTGDQGGYAEGVFLFRWQGNMLFAENTAVDDRYLLGWSEQPGDARTDNSSSNRNRLLIWHANYHPDGGQLFYPLTLTPFVVALAPPGDDVRPEDWVALWCDGSFGICIDPGVWHEAVAPLAEAAEFLDKQGRVHARVSCDMAREFGRFLSIPLTFP